MRLAPDVWGRASSALIVNGNHTLRDPESKNGTDMLLDTFKWPYTELVIPVDIPILASRRCRNR